MRKNGGVIILIAGVLCAVLITAMCPFLVQYEHSSRIRTYTSSDITAMGTEKININTADKETLRLLPHIGETLCDRIIAYREKHGGFQSIEEIKNIKGIGEEIFADIALYITV